MMHCQCTVQQRPRNTASSAVLRLADICWPGLRQQALLLASSWQVAATIIPHNHNIFVITAATASTTAAAVGSCFRVYHHHHHHHHHQITKLSHSIMIPWHGGCAKGGLRQGALVRNSTVTGFPPLPRFRSFTTSSTRVAC
jgi:hypothetical protein